MSQQQQEEQKTTKTKQQRGRLIKKIGLTFTDGRVQRVMWNNIG